MRLGESQGSGGRSRSRLSVLVRSSRPTGVRVERGVCCSPGAEARDNVGGDCEDVARADLALRQVEGSLLLHVHHQRRSCGTGHHGRWVGERAQAPFDGKQASALERCVRACGRREGAVPANMEKKDEKKPHHDTWKARECGLLVSRMMNWVALCSASTCTRTVDAVR